MKDHKKKFFLFKQSKNFCAVPWNYFKIDTNGDVTTCVFGKEKLGNIKTESIEKILSNPKLIKIKKDLYNDVKTPNCVKCHQLDVEEVSYKYLRDMYNNWFLKSPVDYSDFNSFYFSGVDLHWGSTCNLKCITCWERQSSSIAQEKKLPIININSQYTESVIEWMLDNQNGIKEMYFSGGEPTLINHNYNLLKNLKPREDMLLRVNTNMTFETDNKIINELKRFPNVLFTVSADAIYKRFEYIRQGATWEKFIGNLNDLSKTHFKWRINSVFFVGSALTLVDTQKFFYENYGITDFTINQCGMGQRSLECKNLPDNVKLIVKDKIEKRLSEEKDLNIIGQFNNCLKELEMPNNELDYRNYFDHIDNLRGTNWKEIFTELV